MDYLPKDPVILVSSINMFLREGRSPRDYRVSTLAVLSLESDLESRAEKLEKML